MSIETYVLIVVAAFCSGVLHGATGMAGGILMATILAWVIGIKTAVPVMTIALVLSHLSRVAMYARDTDWTVARQVLLFGGPMTVLGAYIFSVIDATAISLIFAVFLLAAVPGRAWAEAKRLRAGPKLLASASAGWGLLAGNVIGPGFVLAPFLLGTGMGRLAFVGTLACVALFMNIVKLGVFGATGLITLESVYLGILIGVLTVPGNWVGRAILKSLGDKTHSSIIDAMTILLAINFLVLAYFS